MADRYNLIYSGEQVNTAIGRGLTSLQPTAQTLSDIQKQTVRTNIGAMGASNVYNPNLLINGDFAINQRGASSYTSTETAIYTVDRFHLVNGTLTKTSTGISISPSTTSCQIRQYIENPTAFDGKYLILSFSCNGTVYTSLSQQLDIPNTNTAICTVSLSGIGNLRIRVYNNNVFLQFTLDNANKPTTTFEWVKLELGSIATPFVPPLTAEELPKCQRYGIPIRLHGGANYATSTTSILCGIPLPSTLRTTPTITVSTQPTAGGNGSTYTVTNTTVNSTYSNEVILAITTSGITANEIYALQGGMAFLDAEIY